MEDIRANPDKPGKSLNDLLFYRFGLYMRLSTLYRMKRYVIDKLFGGHDESYAHLPAYAEIIKETNPESKAFCAWKNSEGIPRQLLFTSIFISFSAQWKGFLGGCRPLIGVDGCHLKGNYGGVLLSAVAMDGNNEIYPIAFAIVSVEDKYNWSFFFRHLHNIVKDSKRENWTVISDRQKGVDLALKDVWPTTKRRYCCRHLSRNFKRRFPGPAIYILFWRACNATNPFTFRKAMEKLQKIGGSKVMEWFSELGNQSKWSKHKFDPNVCNDSNPNNFLESFNSTLGIDRCRSVLTLLEGIRRVCMVRIAIRHQDSLNWNDVEICPKVVKMLREISMESTKCKLHMSRPGEYEIHEGKSQFPLSLNRKICSCGAWQLSGIPCRHAIRVMVHARVDPQKYVSSWYSVKTYKQVYSYTINPIPDNEQWPTYESIPTILPSKMKRGVGRPSSNRKRGEKGEDQPGKRSKTMRCKKCQCFGHNSRTCKGGLTGKELREKDEPIVIKNPRIRDQSKAVKEARAAMKASNAPNLAATQKGKGENNGEASTTQIRISQMSQPQFIQSQP
ncbi:uncharacterized protein LOC104889107 [Beta vulgaris subsp. vulgaris]|uniref:uncharacterized protein LOC104889107 n=1 Tax=Beta vulgaris subsp. vulgaris TaxID=3555 RepID=UPI00203718D6|nr:uncharacterized protein LOC104889107 [Beta vulgaris subsp. vulgaris]